MFEKFREKVMKKPIFWVVVFAICCIAFYIEFIK